MNPFLFFWGDTNILDQIIIFLPPLLSCDNKNHIIYVYYILINLCFVYYNYENIVKVI